MHLRWKSWIGVHSCSGSAVQVIHGACTKGLVTEAIWLQVLERAPVAPAGQQHVLFEQFWLERGPFALPEHGTDGKLLQPTPIKVSW